MNILEIARQIAAGKTEYKGYTDQCGHSRGTDCNGNGVPEWDCTNFQWAANRLSGNDVPYMTTHQLANEWEKSRDGQDSYYEGVPCDQVRPGDTVVIGNALFPMTSGHAGIVSEYDCQTGSGKLIGSQGSTGVAETCFGEGSDHFNSKSIYFLRVKPQYQTGEPLPLDDPFNPRHPVNPSGNPMPPGPECGSEFYKGGNTTDEFGAVQKSNENSGTTNNQQNSSASGSGTDGAFGEKTGPPQPGEKGALDYEQTGPPTPDQEPASLTQSETWQMYADAKDHINFGSDANYVSGDSATTGSSGNSATQDNTSAHTGNGGIISQPFTVNPALAPEGQGQTGNITNGPFQANSSMDPNSQLAQAESKTQASAAAQQQAGNQDSGDTDTDNYALADLNSFNDAAGLGNAIANGDGLAIAANAIRFMNDSGSSRRIESAINNSDNNTGDSDEDLDSELGASASALDLTNALQDENYIGAGSAARADLRISR